MSKNALKFVRELRLPTDDELAEELYNIRGAQTAASPGSTVNGASEGKQTAAVVGGSLTSFTQNVSGQSNSDVKNATLLAQLASNVQFDKYTEPMKWYKNYVNILENIGWNNPGFAFDNYTSGGSTVQMDEAVLEIVAAIATGNELAMVEATMQGLKGLAGDSKQIKIWDAQASDGKNGNFQIMPVDQLPNGDVAMVLTGMQFNAKTSHGQFLFWSWSSTSIEIQRAVAKFVLNEDVYAQVRQAIVEKLGKRAVQFVAGIPLPD